MLGRCEQRLIRSLSATIYILHWNKTFITSMSSFCQVRLFHVGKPDKALITETLPQISRGDCMIYILLVIPQHHLLLSITILSRTGYSGSGNHGVRRTMTHSFLCEMLRPASCTHDCLAVIKKNRPTPCVWKQWDPSILGLQCISLGSFTSNKELDEKHNTAEVAEEKVMACVWMYAYVCVCHCVTFGSLLCYYERFQFQWGIC